MIEFTCPKCRAELEVPDSDAGKKSACPECGQRFMVAASKPAKKPATPPSRPPGKAVAPGGKSAPKARPREDDEDEENDDRLTAKRPSSPAPRKLSAGSKSRRHEDDDEEDDRPRKKKQGSSKVLMFIILGVGGGLAACAAVVILVIVLVSGRGTNVPNPSPSGPQMMGQGMPVGPGMQPPVVAPKENTPVAVADAKPPDPPRANESPMGGGGPANGQKVYQYLLKSTVLIIHPVTVHLPNGGQAIAISMGSGSLIDKTNRLILTNYHVVGDATRLSVFFPTYKDGKMITEQQYFFTHLQDAGTLRGTVLAREEKVDLAIIKLDRLPDDVKALPFASAQPTPGTQVFSVGHPGRSGGLWLFTEGKVKQLLHKAWTSSDESGSHLMSCDADIVLTDSLTNPGDSGGPLVNSRGELVAVVHGSDPGARGLSLFIDGVEIRRLLDRYTASSGVKLALETGSALAALEDAATLPDLLRTLENPDATTRAKAARSLGEVGAGAKIAIPGLLKALHDTDEVVRKLSLEALNKIGAPESSDVPKLIAALKDQNSDVRLYAAGALGRIGPAARPATAALVEVLKDQETTVRQNAARSLGNLGPDAKERAQPALLEAINDADLQVREAAAEGLASLPLSGQDLPLLLPLLKHKDSEVRAPIVQAMGKVGPDGKSALRPLAEMLRDRSPRVRRAAVQSLTALAADNKEILPDVEKVLKDPDKEVRRLAIAYVGGFGVDAKSAAKALADSVQDPDLRKDAIAALTKIGPPAAKDATPALLVLLNAPDKADRLLALTALATLKPSGPEVKEIIPKLITLFENADPPLRDKAVETFGRIGKTAVPALAAAMNDPSKGVRLGAVLSLGEIGPPAREALVIIVRHLQLERDRDVLEACQKAVAKINR